MAHKTLTSSSARFCISSLRSSRLPLCWRTFTSSCPHPAAEQQSPPTTAAPTSQPRQSSNTTILSASASRENVLSMLGKVSDKLGEPGSATASQYGLGPINLGDKYAKTNARYGDDEHHLHVLSTKHNTHLTFSDPDRKSIISISSGNLGFRKSQRGTYDAAYQLMAYLLTRLQQDGLMSKIVKLELALRGFGQGRDAVTKVLLGNEGTRLRETIVRVVDKTKLKIGGPRSPRARRLG